MKFWPFPLMCNYPADPAVSELLLAFAASPTLRIEAGEAHHITIVSDELGTLRIWNSNRYYAWANEGAWLPPTAADRLPFIWTHAMGSRYAMRRLRKALAAARQRELGALTVASLDALRAIQAASKTKEAA